MRSGWLRPRGSSSIEVSEKDSETSSSAMASSSSRKWSSGALESFRISLSGPKRTTATPKERLFRKNYKVCADCGAIGHVQADCPGSEMLKPNSPTYEEQSEAQNDVRRPESVLIYRSTRKKSVVSVLETPTATFSIPRDADELLSENRSAEYPLQNGVLSSFTSSPIIEPSMSSQSNRASPYSSSSLHSGFPEGVTHSMPGVEFPENFEDDDSLVLHSDIAEQKMYHWNSYNVVDALEETFSFRDGSGTSGTSGMSGTCATVDESGTTIATPAQRRKENLASSLGSASDWSDFEKYGIDVDLFVGQNRISFSEATPIWDSFTRGNPEEYLKLPEDPRFRKTKSAVLQPRKWGSEDWGTSCRSDLQRQVFGKSKRMSLNEVGQEQIASGSGWLPSFMLRNSRGIEDDQKVSQSGVLPPNNNTSLPEKAHRRRFTMFVDKNSREKVVQGLESYEVKYSSGKPQADPRIKSFRDGREYVVKSLKNWISKSRLGAENRKKN